MSYICVSPYYNSFFTYILFPCFLASSCPLNPVFLFLLSSFSCFLVSSCPLLIFFFFKKTNKKTKANKKTKTNTLSPRSCVKFYTIPSLHPLYPHTPRLFSIL
eukprot:UN04263